VPFALRSELRNHPPDQLSYSGEDQMHQPPIARAYVGMLRFLNAMAPNPPGG
jgi:hypothetical protein